MSSSSNPRHAHDSTLGVALIGLCLTSILYGVTLLQCFMYFNRYYRDNKVLKTLVGTIMFLDTVHTAIVLHILYYYLVSNYDNPPALDLIVWSLGLEVGLTTFAAIGVQSFFIWRVWMLSGKNWILTWGIATLAFVAFATGWGCMIEAWRLGTIANLAQIEWLVGVKHGTVAAADIAIAVAQCWYLHNSRTGMRRTDTLINTLMVYTINRGILNSVAAVADLGCFLAMPDNFVWLAFNFIMSKLYSNSLLATLNTRDALRGRGADTDLATLTTFRTMEFGQKNTTLDLRTNTSAPTDPSETTTGVEHHSRDDKAPTLALQFMPTTTTEEASRVYFSNRADDNMASSV